MSIKERLGIIVSDKMEKTVVVAVANRVVHPKYGKTMIKTRRYKAHAEHNQCQVGDTVKIQETRPLSRTKRWKVVHVISTSMR